MQRPTGFLTCLVAGAIACGCSAEKPTAGTSGMSDAGPIASNYLLETEPAGAVGVGAAHQSASDNGKLTVVGRIGGSESPFVEGLAAFTIVDPKVEYCAPDEGCPTPWDYCCTTDQLPGNSAVVKVVDGQGKVLGQDARKILNVKELSMVVVQGSAKRDAEGNLTVLAEKVYVRP